MTTEVVHEVACPRCESSIPVPENDDLSASRCVRCENCGNIVINPNWIPGNFHLIGMLQGIFVLLVLSLGIIFMVQMPIYDKIDADRPNWDTIVDLDLPVDVTRMISESSTTFVYSPRGDERVVFFTYGGDSVSNNEIKIPLTAHNPSKGDPWPAVGLKVIRNNGPIEEYQLPMRGGAVREESTSANGTGVPV